MLTISLTGFMGDNMLKKHRKFAAYWNNIGKPMLDAIHSDGAWRFCNYSEIYFDAADYRIKDDLHWELRREWIDSDFTLPIDWLNGISGKWEYCKHPTWDSQLQYRKAQTKDKAMLELQLKVGGKYLLRSGKEIQLQTNPWRSKDTHPFIGSNQSIYKLNGKYYMDDSDHQCDIIQEITEEKPDFATQQEIWSWLVENNKVENIETGDVVFFNDGDISHYAVSFEKPKQWKKYIEPKKIEWFHALDGTEENAMVCWLTCSKHTLFIAFRTETKGGVVYIYNDNQNCVYENQIQPIMPLSEFKKLYFCPL